MKLKNIDFRHADDDLTLLCSVYYATLTYKATINFEIETIARKSIYEIREIDRGLWAFTFIFLFKETGSSSTTGLYVDKFLLLRGL